MLKKNIMKKVVRLTESDLIRIVKRVISEQSATPSMGVTPVTIANSIKTAVEGENINQLEKAVNMIKDAKTCEEVARRLESNSILDYIGGEMKTSTFWMGEKTAYANQLEKIGRKLMSISPKENMGSLYREHKGFWREIFNMKGEGF